LAMRLYHMTKFDKTINFILKDRRLKIGLFNELNDPFELACFDRHDRDQRAGFEQITDSFTAKYGVLCFSASSKSPLMWAHYAEAHKGVCLGFDIPAEQVTEVDYAARRLVLEVDEFESPEDLDSEILKRFLRTKYKQW